MAASLPTAPRLASAHLPAELAYVYLAAPLVLEPIVNKDVFDEPWRQILMEIAGNYIPWLGIPLAIHAWYRWVMPALVARVRRLPGLLLLHTGACALVAALSGALLYPLHHLVTRGDLLPFPAYLRLCVGMMCLLIVPALFVQELRDRAHAAERLALEGRQATLRAQLEALQSRTQPHFLFNVLNTIASLVRTDPGLAEKTVERLARILRHALAGLGAGGLPVAGELAMVEEYLQVQQARFESRLRYTLEVSPELAGASTSTTMAPFLLQPLVENAILHGMSEGSRGVTVGIRAARQDQQLVFQVDDDGPGPGASRHRGNGQSLNELRARLALVYGDGAGLATGRNEAGGFTARLTVPAVLPAGPPR